MKKHGNTEGVSLKKNGTQAEAQMPLICFEKLI